MGILLDSYNFSQKEKPRWVLWDLQAVQNIEERVSKERQISFEELERVKFDTKRNCALPL